MPTLSAKQRRELPDRAFAYIDREGHRRLPINDEGHVRAALARFNQVQFENENARAEAFKRLLLAARKYGIVPIGFVTRQMRGGAPVTRAPQLPSGLVTLLFTDIEASTALLEMLGDGYIEVLEEVRTLLRNAVKARKGAEVDARADEFFAAFARPADAIAAAIDIQLELSSRTWPGRMKVQVRAGLHSGKPKLTEGAYVGLPVHTANRICSAAHGGQILLSQETVEAMSGAPPEGVAFRELGSYRLRGIARVHALHQVEADGLRATFPALRDGARPAEEPATASFRSVPRTP
jgi:class 3 adenylate cyclase